MRARFPNVSSASPAVGVPKRHLTPGRQYSVYAVSEYAEQIFLLIVDDLQTPIFLPASIFDIVDNGVPSGWLMSVLEERGVRFVLGPPFIAGDFETYQAMVDAHYRSTSAFWEAIDRGQAPGPWPEQEKV